MVCDARDKGFDLILSLYDPRVERNCPPFDTDIRYAFNDGPHKAGDRRIERSVLPDRNAMKSGAKYCVLVGVFCDSDFGHPIPSWDVPVTVVETGCLIARML